MLKSKLLAAVSTVLIMAGCTSFGECPLSAVYCGTFEGTLPAADAAGIETTLRLNRDSSFSERSVYIGKPDGVFYEKGTYKIVGNTVELHLNGGERNYYRIENNQLRRLDMQGQPITGALADNYVLTRTAPCR